MPAPVITPQMGAFIRWAVPLSTRTLVARGLRLNRSTLCGYTRKHGVVAGRRGKDFRPLSDKAVRRAWLAYSRSGQLPAEVWECAEEPSNTPGSRKWWTQAEVEYVAEHWGRQSPQWIAETLRRPLRRVLSQAFKLGLPMYSQRELARRICASRGLRIGNGAVCDWCKAGQVRSWSAGKWVFIHVDDAEWLIENYRWGEPFPRHPGLLIEAELRLAA